MLKIIDSFLFSKDCSIPSIFSTCFRHNNNRDTLLYKPKKYWRHCFKISLKKKEFRFSVFIVNCFYCGIVFLTNKFVDGTMIVASHLVFSTLKWGSNQIIQILHYYAVPTSFSLPLVPHAPRLIINPHDARRSVIYKFLTMVTKNMFTRRECGRKSLEKALTVSKTFFKRFFTLNLK